VKLQIVANKRYFFKLAPSIHCNVALISLFIFFTFFSQEFAT